MTVRYFSEVREHDARYYRDYVARTHWLKLRTFRHALERSDANLSQLDGSSDSLVPLWQWVRAGLRVNFSFLEELGPSSPWQALGVEYERDMARRTLVNEWLGHYIFEQLRSIDPATDWVFKDWEGKGPQEFAVQQTVIQFRRHQVETQNLFLGAFEMSERDVPVWSGDDALYRWATKWQFNGASPIPTTPTFMERAAEVPGIDAPPRRLRAASAPEHDDVTLGGIYYIARLADGEADLMTGAPLPAQDLAEVLARNDYVSAADERRPPSPRDVNDGVQAMSPDRAVIVEPLWLDGQLRAAEVRMYVSSLRDHSDKVDRIHAMSAEIGATVVAKDLID